ncbi:MAG: hypothetical protein KC503_36390 [Myxococcales bacterium]|nr:hypothetical protein [Myxococcales bacterium]
MTTKTALLVIVSLTVCGCSARTLQQGDGAVQPDVLAHETRSFVIRSLSWPRDAEQAAAYGYDYNGDGVADNAFGAIVAGLAGVVQGDAGGDGYLVPFGTLGDERLELDIVRGDNLMLLRLSAPDFSGGYPVAATAWRGQVRGCCDNRTSLETCWPQAKTRCFAADAELAVASAAYPMSGTIEGDKLALQAERFALTLTLGTERLAVSLELRNVRLRGVLREGAIEAGVLSGLIAPTELRDTLQRAIWKLISAYWREHDRAPVFGTTRDQFLDLFDRDKDGDVSFDEYVGNSLLQTFWSGDLDLDGDKMYEMSLGIGFTAVSVRIRD